MKENSTNPVFLKIFEVCCYVSSETFLNDPVYIIINPPTPIKRSAIGNAELTKKERQFDLGNLTTFLANCL